MKTLKLRFKLIGLVLFVSLVLIACISSNAVTVNNEIDTNQTPDESSVKFDMSLVTNSG